MYVISDPIYLMKKTGNHHMHTATIRTQLTGDLAVLKDQFTGIRPSHSQLIELLGCAETWHSLQSQDSKNPFQISILTD